VLLAGGGGGGGGAKGLAATFTGGSGRRLFENLREPGPQFRIDNVLAGTAATHLRYVRQ